MTYALDDLPEEVVDFLTVRHLATLTTTGVDGGPQVTPVGVTYQPETRTARVITWSAAIKARNIERDPGQRVAICQVDGGSWLTLYGTARVTDEPEAVAEAVARYAARYRQPKERQDRVVIEVDVQRINGTVR